MKNNQQNERSAQERVNAGAASVRWNSVAGAAPQPGAHLVTPRCGYSHHGIYVGDGKVVHYAGLCGSLHRGPVQEVSLTRFAVGHEVWIEACPFPRYTGSVVVRRARSRLDEDRYRLLTNNCEHFCAWCLYGESRSEQVQAWLAHPRMALRTAINLFKAFLEGGSQATYTGVGTV